MSILSWVIPHSSASTLIDNPDFYSFALHYEQKAALTPPTPKQWGLSWLSGEGDSSGTGDLFWMRQQHRLISYGANYSLCLVLWRRQQPPPSNSVSPPHLHYAKSLRHRMKKKKFYLFIISFWAQISSLALECRCCTFTRTTSKHGQAGWKPASKYQG